jgi:hypothetical protein
MSSRNGSDMPGKGSPATRTPHVTEGLHGDAANLVAGLIAEPSVGTAVANGRW